MIKNGKGTIINFASFAGYIGGAGRSVYPTSKHAVIGYTNQLTIDYGPKGIKANGSCPGEIETGMIKDIFADESSGMLEAINQSPAGRASKPEEITDLSLFLASNKSDFIHG